MTKEGDPEIVSEQIQGGVSLYPTIIPALKPWAEKFGIPLPTPIA